MLLTAALLCTVGCSSPDDSEESNPWVGKTYVLSIPETNWTDPPKVGKDIGPFVPHFAIQVEGASGDELDVLLGAANADGTQQTRNPTSTVKAVSKSGGFELGPVDVPVYVENVDEETGEGPKVIAPIYDLKMTNVLPNGSTPATAGTFVGTMDFRAIYCLFTLIMSPSADAVCNTMASEIQVQCVPCRDSQPYCLTVTAQEVGATLGTTIQPVDKSTAQKCLD